MLTPVRPSLAVPVSFPPALLPYFLCLNLLGPSTSWMPIDQFAVARPVLMLFELFIGWRLGSMLPRAALAHTERPTRMCVTALLRCTVEHYGQLLRRTSIDSLSWPGLVDLSSSNVQTSIWRRARVQHPLPGPFDSVVITIDPIAPFFFLIDRRALSDPL